MLPPTRSSTSSPTASSNSQSTITTPNTSPASPTFPRSLPPHVPPPKILDPSTTPPPLPGPHRLRHLSSATNPSLPNLSTLYISIAALCPKNGHSPTLSSFSVHFGPGSKFNRRGLIPVSQVGTGIAAAEGFAIHEALRMVLLDSDLRIVTRNLKRVIIATTSQHAILSQTSYLEKWLRNGWKTARVNEVKSRRVACDNVLGRRRLWRERGFEVYFLRVEGGEGGGRGAARMAVWEGRVAEWVELGEEGDGDGREV